MALTQSAVSELLEASRTGEAVDLIGESAWMVMQELIETEATEKIGAARYERTESRITERNGSLDRLQATQAEGVELRIPKFAQGVVLPGHPRTPPAHRPGALRSDHGGLRLGRLHPQRR